MVVTIIRNTLVPPTRMVRRPFLSVETSLVTSVTSYQSEKTATMGLQSNLNKTPRFSFQPTMGDTENYLKN